MKKFISIISAIAMIATLGTATISANAEETYVKGDFNGDGIVDMYDVYDINDAFTKIMLFADYSNCGNDLEAQKSASKAYVMESYNFAENKFASVDVFEDGYLDSRDSLAIIYYLAAKHFGYAGDIEPNTVNAFLEGVNKRQVNLYYKELVDSYKAEHPNASGIGYVEYGDMNSDQYVDSKDAIEILDYYSNKLASTSVYTADEANWIEEFGDYNGDGAVDSKDAVDILKFYAEEMATEK